MIISCKFHDFFMFFSYQGFVLRTRVRVNAFLEYDYVTYIRVRVSVFFVKGEPDQIAWGGT